MYSVLYVDDEDALLDVCKRFLEQGGDISIDTVPSASEAMEKIKKKPYDAVISDYQMPGMDGITFLKNVRSEFGDIPFILFTGKGREEVVIQAINNGADFYVQKGGDPRSQFAELAHKIRQSVHHRQDGKALHESEERYRNVVEDQTEFICRFRPDGTHVFVNEAYCRYFNKRKEELIGQRFIPRIPPEDQNAIHAHFASLTGDHPVTEIRHRIVMPDGQVRWQRWSDRAIFDAGGRVIEYQSVGRDITDIVVAEEKLRESEEKYRRFFQTSRDCIFITSRDGRWIDFNDAAVELFGYLSREELMGVKIPDLYADARDRAKHISVIAEQRYTRDYPVDLKKKDGTIFPTVITTVAQYDERGNVVGFQGTIRDITAQKQAEERLRESEELFRNVIDTQTEFICRFRPDGTHVFVNEAYCRYFGKRSTDLIGKKFTPEIPAEDRARLKKYFTTLSHDNPIATIDHRIVMPDGSIRWQRWVDRAIFDEQGNLTEYQTVGRDITDVKKAETALAESRLQLLSIIQGSPIPMFVIDKDHRLVYWNRALEKYSGIKAEEVTGTSQHWRAFYKAERPCLADLVLDGTIQERARQLYENRISPSKLIDGAYEGTDFVPHMGRTGTYLYFTAAPITDKEGRIIGAVETLEDITERRSAEEALKQAIKKLHLLSSITRHDILNQLTALQTYLELSREGGIGAEHLQEYIAKEWRVVDTIRHQIEFIRDYEELGIQSPQWQDIRRTVDQAVSAISMGSVVLSVDCTGIEIYADLLLGKVYSNLIMNSLQHGEKVTRITISCHPYGNDLKLIMEDDGIGIPDQEKENIFNRRYFRHTGFGMLLSQEILSLTGMSIRETGEHGKGARFEITVPEGMYRFTAP